MEKLILLALLIYSFTVIHASEAENKVLAGRQKAAEIIARDNKGESIENIAEREKKKELEKSRKPATSKTSSQNITQPNGRHSRLELWRMRRKQTKNKQ
ncbi:MAG: hypothetical protein JXR78_05340 [Victivallales bacterium]|nr:hypothetical protein [Victivallales bacterium]